MADPNEELVRRYFELQGYFVRTNVRYAYRTEKGMGWSDIDLCVLHPLTGDAAAIEVKGWHTEKVTSGYWKAWPNLLHFTRPEATAAVEELMGRSDFRRILVVGRVGSRQRDEVFAYAGERGVEILEFPQVLTRLIEGTPTDRSAGSEVEHAIRVLKVYGFVDTPSPRAPAGPPEPTAAEQTPPSNEPTPAPQAATEHSGDSEAWTSFGRAELRRYGMQLVDERLSAAGFTVEWPTDGRSNLLIARDGQRRLKIHVRISRDLNYTFLTQRAFTPAPGRFACLVALVRGERPSIFLIPSQAWETPSTILVDRRFEEGSSEPEWGINLSRNALTALVEYDIEPVLQQLSGDGRDGHE